METDDLIIYDLCYVNQKHLRKSLKTKMVIIFFDLKLCPLRTQLKRFNRIKKLAKLMNRLEYLAAFCVDEVTPRQITQFVDRIQNPLIWAPPCGIKRGSIEINMEKLIWQM